MSGPAEADKGQLGWMPLMEAVAQGSLAEGAILVNSAVCRCS